MVILNFLEKVKSLSRKGDLAVGVEQMDINHRGSPMRKKRSSSDEVLAARSSASGRTKLYVITDFFWCLEGREHDEL